MRSRVSKSKLVKDDETEFIDKGKVVGKKIVRVFSGDVNSRITLKSGDTDPKLKQSKGKRGLGETVSGDMP